MNNHLYGTINNRLKNIKKYELYNNATICTDLNDNKFVVKKNNNINQLYNYLSSRGFNYMPKLLFSDNDIYIYKYEMEIKTPDEQKMSDLIKLDALLHNKTVYYKDISESEVKEIYEKLNRKIDDIYYYYDDIMNIIESKIYMSPAQYMLSRNISSVFSSLNFCKNKLNDWYEIMKKKTKKRVVLLHNNLSLDHLIKTNEDNVIISWNEINYDIPIYDFIKLYKNNYDKYDFSELYKEYNKLFPFLDEEKILLFIYLFIPDKIIFLKNELLNTINVSKLCNYLYNTDKLFMENEAEDTKVQNKNINKE